MPTYKKRYNSFDLEAHTLAKENELLDLLRTLVKQKKIPANNILSDRFRNLKEIKVNPDAIVPEQEQLDKIQKELIKYYGFSEDQAEFLKEIRQKDTYRYVYNNEAFLSPRATWLIWRYKHSYLYRQPENWELATLKETGKDSLLATAYYQVKAKMKGGESVLDNLREKFDVGKKGLDIMDDLVGAILRSPIIKKYLPEKLISSITPIIIFTVVGIIHLVEGSSALWSTFKTLFIPKTRELKKDLKASQDFKSKNKKSGKMDSKPIDAATGIGIVFAAASGLYAGSKALMMRSISLMKSMFYANLMPVITTFIVYFITLRNGVRNFILNNNYEEKKYETYEEFSDNKKGIKINLKDRLNNLIKAKEVPIEAHNIHSTDEQIEEVRRYHEIFLLDHKLTKIKRLQEKKQNIRKEFIVNIMEIVASLIVATGVTISSIASAGVAPSILMGIGVGTGLAVKLIEYLDNKYHFLVPMKNFIVNKFESLFTKLNKNIISPIKNFVVNNFGALFTKFNKNVILPIQTWFCSAEQSNPEPVPATNVSLQYYTSDKIAGWLNSTKNISIRLDVKMDEKANSVANADAYKTEADATHDSGIINSCETQTPATDTKPNSELHRLRHSSSGRLG